MPPRAVRALKLFVWTAVPFGVVMGLVYALVDLTGRAPENAWRTGLVLGAAVGVAFGVVLTAVTLVADKLRRDATGIPLSVGTRPTHRMRVERPVEQVVQQARSVLWHVTGATAAEDPRAGTLSATTRPSWWSWGDVVTVTVHPDGPHAALVEVASRPRLRATLVDYGSNAGHVRQVAQGLVPPA
ncbi:hypothetical protein [Solicola sp. PLA-1-18]|uniref:hypothetical protein n=1 Tax=Solicola sp. PLA-1-18 TaxID=3380532 RepID=UPI003B8299FD